MIGALIDGMDLIVVTVPDPAAGTIRSLQARARERGCVLLPTRPWPGSDLVMERTAVEWAGLGRGRGRLRWQKGTFRTSGRGKAVRPGTLEMVFPPQSVLIGQRRLSAETLAVPWGSPLLEPPVWRAQSQPTAGDTMPASRRPTESAEYSMWADLQPNDPPGLKSRRGEAGDATGGRLRPRIGPRQWGTARQRPADTADLEPQGECDLQ